MPEAARVGGSLADWVRLLRPHQWVKNFFVLGPLVFSGRALDPPAILQALAAFAAFCLISSGVYAANDAIDRDADRVHPVKRLRPVAAGRIGARDAVLVGGGFMVAALILAWLVSPRIAPLLGLYLAINTAYMWRLKKVVVLDVFVIASLFVIRLVAGAVAISVQPSVWLLLCGGLLALYLGFTKRRHELVLMEGKSPGHRSVLSHYSAAFLDQMAGVLLAVTVVCYIMYTRDSATANAVGSDSLTYSTVFVLYGVFRYLYLVHERGGGSPTHTLLNDRQLLLIVAGWLLYCGVVIYRPG